jgi:hypothetical protein
MEKTQFKTAQFKTVQKNTKLASFSEEPAEEKEE